MPRKGIALILFMFLVGVVPVGSQDVTGAMMGMVNNLRAQHGAPPVSYNGQLVNAAQQHSNDMAAGDFLSHTGSDGSNFSARAGRNGYSMTWGAENVLYRWDGSVAGAYDQWYNSPGHFNNMINPNVLEMGVAYAVSADGKHYFTMVLGNRPGFVAPEAAPPPTNTPVPPPPTSTPLPPPTWTPVPLPTNTPIPPPTWTPVPPPTSTPLPPPTWTPVPVQPSATPVAFVPSATPVVAAVVPSNTPIVIPSATATTAFAQVVVPSATAVVQQGALPTNTPLPTLPPPTAAPTLDEEPTAVVFVPTATQGIRPTAIPLNPPTKPPTAIPNNNGNAAPLPPQPTAVAMAIVPFVADPMMQALKLDAVLPGNGNVPLGLDLQPVAPQPEQQAEQPAAPAPVQPTSAPVLLPPDVRLLWDASTFSLVNVSGGNLDLNGLSFSSDSGEMAITRWQTEYLSAPLYAIPDGDCLQVWGLGVPQQNKPQACNFRHAWVALQAYEQFWTGGAAQFSVNRGADVLAVCNVAQGACEFSLSGDVSGQAPLNSGGAAPSVTTATGNENVQLVYDNMSFSIVNTSAVPVNLADLTFDSINGMMSIYKWDNGYLSASLSGFPAQDCLQVWHVNTPNQPKPAACATRHSWVAIDSSAEFWVNVDQFTVRQRGELIATCGASGICDIQVR